MSKVVLDTIEALTSGDSSPVDDVVNGSARAWVNFNGAGTVTIRQAYNVSSITDNGTGDYTVNFSNALEDDEFNVVGTASVSLAAGAFFSAPKDSSNTTTSCRCSTFSTAISATDCQFISASFFR